MTDARPLSAPRRAVADPTIGSLMRETSSLNGRFQEASERAGRLGGLSFAHWQVVAEVAPRPYTVAQVARRLNLARQSVQRTVDLLVRDGYLELRPNPDHRTSLLVTPTETGRLALDTAAHAQVEWTRQLAETVNPPEVEAAVDLMRQISHRLDQIEIELALPENDLADPTSNDERTSQGDK